MLEFQELKNPCFKQLRISLCKQFLVSGRDLACQQEVSLALTKTPPSYNYNMVDSAFSNIIMRGSCLFNAREHRVSHDTSVRKWNLCA